MSNTAVNITSGVADDSISNAKLVEVAANTIKANPTGSTANPADMAVAGDRLVGRASAVNSGNLADLTAAQVKTLLGVGYADLPAIADKTVVGNASGGSAAPTAQDANALMGILNTATTTLLSGTKITADTITAAQIAANAITSSELADNAVDTAAIADNNVTKAKLEAEVREARQNYATSAGTGTAYTLNLTPDVGSLTAGLELVFKAHTANTASATMAVDSQTAKTMQKWSGGALINLAANDILSGGVYVLRYDGTVFQLLNPAVGSVASAQMQVFSSSGTWTAPAGVTKAKATVVGGSAGGGVAGGGGSPGGGGGGGGGAVSVSLLTVVPGTGYTVTIGAAGAAGGNGGQTSFDTLTANGGTAGGAASGGTGGTGGAGGARNAGADYSTAGAAGADGASSVSGNGVSGAGGSAGLGYGVGAGAKTSAGAGNTGNLYGGGASGGCGSTNAGGAGVKGLCIVEWIG